MSYSRALLLAFLPACSLIYDAGAPPAKDGGNLPDGGAPVDGFTDASPMALDATAAPDAPPGACTIFPAAGCAAPSACYWPGECQAAGEGDDGAPCAEQNDCAPEHACSGGFCRKVCLSAADCNPCVSSTVDPLLFVCDEI